MKISIIIPTYKPQDYLWECLDSIVAQTFSKREFEVILVLNGCCEPWKNNIGKYILRKMQGMNVNFIQTDQAGVSNARNIGLENTKGEYVAFIDDDDYVSPVYLEELYKKAFPDTISLCYPYAFNDGEDEVQLPYSITDAYEYCRRQKKTLKISSKVRKYFSGPCMKLIPMSCIQERRFDFRFRNGEDSLFMFLISDMVKYISFTSNEAIYYRRFRKDSAVTRKRSLQEKIGNAFELMIEETKIYFRGFPRYGFSFYITRLLGAVRGALVG